MAVALLILALGAWGRWLTTTLAEDHDTLTRQAVELQALNSHITGMRKEINAKLEIIVREHREFRRHLTEE